MAMQGRGEMKLPKPEEVMARFDKNKDGKLTKDEVPAPLWGLMSRIADKDGVVTKEAMESARKKLEDRFKSFQGGRQPGMGPMGMGAGMGGPMGMHSRGPQAGDKKMPEAPQGMMGRPGMGMGMRHGMGPQAGGHFGPRADGKVPSGADIVGRFDKNKDGKLTKDEVPSPMWERLTKITGKTDAVTKDDIEAARKKAADQPKKDAPKPQKSDAKEAAKPVK